MAGTAVVGAGQASTAPDIQGRFCYPQITATQVATDLKTGRVVHKGTFSFTKRESRENYWWRVRGIFSRNGTTATYCEIGSPDFGQQ